MKIEINRTTNQWSLFRSFAFMIIALVIVRTNTGDSVYAHNLLTILNICAYAMCLFTWCTTKNRFISLFTAFVAYAFFSNLGQSILFMFGVPKALLSLYTLCSFNTICDMLRFQFTCIAGLNLGVAFYTRSENNCISAKPLYNKSDYDSEDRTQIDILLDFVLYISLIVVFAYTIYQLLQRQTMSYQELYNSRDTLSKIPQYLVVVLGLRSLFKRQHMKLIYACLICFTVGFMIAGTRSMGIIYFGALVASLPLTHHQFFQKKIFGSLDCRWSFWISSN